MKPYDGVFDVDASAHLLRRTSFAPRPGEAESFAGGGKDAAVARLLTAVLVADPESDDRDAALRGSDERDLVAGSWIARLVTTADPLREAMVLFWHDHFVSAFAKVGDARMMQEQLALFRRSGLGSFAALTVEVARDPAMVRYLDLERSTKSAPNENFARELFELFTTGPGPYAESDLKEAARAFTGYGLRAGRFRFLAADHDAGLKSILGMRGLFDGAAVARMAADRPETAWFLARKFARRFLADEPAAEDVAALARSFAETHGDVARVLKDLLSSDAFFAARNRLAVTRCPAAFVVAALKAAGARACPAPADLARRARSMGRAILDPPSVKGYAGGAAWLNPATRLARLDFVVGLIAGHGSELRPPALATRDDLRSFAAATLGRRISDHEAAALAAAVAEDDPMRDLKRLGLVLTRPEFDRC